MRLWLHTIKFLVYRLNQLVAFHNTSKIQSMCHVVAKAIDYDYSWGTKLVKHSIGRETLTDLLWDGCICVIYIYSNDKNTSWTYVAGWKRRERF
jgi:hypothetical protein